MKSDAKRIFKIITCIPDSKDEAKLGNKLNAKDLEVMDIIGNMTNISTLCKNIKVGTNDEILSNIIKQICDKVNKR